MDLQPKEFKFIPVNYQKPTIIGAYSLDRERKFQNNFNQLRYFKIPSELNFTLKKGEVESVPDYNSKERIAQMTKFIMANPKQCFKNNRVDADFVCFRGVLRFLMSTPYDKYRFWTVDAAKLKDTIYLSMDTDMHPKKSVPQYFYPSKNSIKFHRSVFSLDPQVEVKEQSNEIIYENEEFCIALSTRIDNQLKLIFGMQCDGVESETAIRSLDSLKTSKLRVLKSLKVDGKFKYLTPHVSLKWWCQSYVSAIENIYVGIRDDDWMIKKIMTYSIDKLEEENGKHWSRNVCLNFLKNFLKTVQSDMKDINDSYTILRYKWDPLKDQKINCTKLEKQNGFFSEEYVAFINDSA